MIKTGAGNFIGSCWNTLLLDGLWLVLGYAMEKIFRAFNSTMKLLPTLQDAVNGMSQMQFIWSILFIGIFLVIWANYIMNENSHASGGV